MPPYKPSGRYASNISRPVTESEPESEPVALPPSERLTSLRLGHRYKIIGGPVLARGRIGVVTGPKTSQGYWPILLTGAPLNHTNGYLVRADEVEEIK